MKKSAIKHFVGCSLLLIFCAVAMTQTAPPPVTKIFLVDVTNHNGQMKVSKPVSITAFEGYNNQPSFLPDGRSLFFTSIREGGQADIYRYDLGTGATVRVTETRESEFSPTVTPDRKFFSVVRVEADQTQRLWKFPIAGGTPSLVLQKIKPVGYHVWIDAHTLALFVLGTPSTLQLVDVLTEHTEVIAQNIGRTLLMIPHQKKLSFVQKISEQEFEIKSFDLKTRQTATLIKALPGNEFFTWTPRGEILMAKGSKLYKWNPAHDSDWQEVADFSSAGISEITRIAVSPNGNKIAFVAKAGR
ncbi:MAG: hypothetical protein AUG51_01050 [Acidobacteria bacterium 13_1_20CM_3_53_8]|nr:MAG: hypothetical protein AUG51_01050 [Acidobacteria bacterium 13_1_20CM_3_53_8]